MEIALYQSKVYGRMCTEYLCKMLRGSGTPKSHQIYAQKSLWQLISVKMDRPLSDSMQQWRGLWQNNFISPMLLDFVIKLFLLFVINYKVISGYYLKARKSKFNLQLRLSKYHVLLQKPMR